VDVLAAASIACLECKFQLAYCREGGWFWQKLFEVTVVGFSGGSGKFTVPLFRLDPYPLSVSAKGLARLPLRINKSPIRMQVRRKKVRGQKSTARMAIQR
jgi:hypothetical protein